LCFPQLTAFGTNRMLIMFLLNFQLLNSVAPLKNSLSLSLSLYIYIYIYILFGLC